MTPVKVNLRAWGYFFAALLVLTLAMALAVASQVASSNSQAITAGILALLALGLAAIIAVTVVPYLARRVRAEGFRLRISYKVTREGMIYFAVTILLGLAAVNTGNNLLYIVLSAMLASIIVSGVASRLTLTGLQLDFDFPERAFAQQPALATVTLTNRKRWLPSFSVSVEPSLHSTRTIQFQSLYFPLVRPSSSQKRTVELKFTRRGSYEQASVRLSTRFPFGFIIKSLEVPQSHQLIVFPALGEMESFFEILPMISGEFESYIRGRGMDLYALRDYAFEDSARMIHWKASARTESLKVKEFAREDERRLVLIFDRMTETFNPEDDKCFESAISLCARLAQHFYDEGADLNFLLENGALLEGRTDETLDQIFTELALLEMRQGPSRLIEQVESLSQEEKDPFKIVFTLRSRGTLPTPLWASSHVIFVRERLFRRGNPLPANEIKETSRSNDGG